VSREAPVLILKYDATQMVAGGAGNAANNVAAHRRPRPAVRAGRRRRRGAPPADKFPSRRRQDARRPRARIPHAGEDGRILAGGVHAARQQVVRIDRDTGWPLDQAVSRAFAKKIGPALDGCDAVILSDYGSGLVTPALADAIRRAVGRRTRRRPIPVLVDSRYRLLDYRGLTTCTPNESEVEAALGIEINDDLEALERAGRVLLRRTRTQAVLITRGSRGMALFQQRQPTIHVPIYGADEVADRDRRRRHRDRRLRPGARRRRIVLRGGAARQLRRRPGRDEARHGDGLGAGAVRRGDQRSRHDARAMVAGRAAAGTAVVDLEQSAVSVSGTRLRLRTETDD